MRAAIEPLPFNKYQTRMAGYRRVDDKFRGFIACSTGASLDDQWYYEFDCRMLSDTPAEAMRAAADLFHELAVEAGEE